MNPIHRLATKHPKPLNLTDTHTTKHWTTRAACRGQTHHMFPKHHKDITYITGARQICSNCPVKTQCLEHALEYPPADMHGVWAGMTSRQLAAEQKRRGIKATRPTLAQMWNEQ
jgi:WhiB family redox-sensing transcriptional regulator